MKRLAAISVVGAALLVATPLALLTPRRRVQGTRPHYGFHCRGASMRNILRRTTAAFAATLATTALLAGSSIALAQNQQNQKAAPAPVRAAPPVRPQVQIRPGQQTALLNQRPGVIGGPAGALRLVRPANVVQSPSLRI
jgi:hypothetical protein